MTLTPSMSKVNGMPEEELRAALGHCCGSKAWVKAMLQKRPYENLEKLCALSSQEWRKLNKADWLEAFSHHPRIGDLKDLKKRFAATAALSTQEQRGVVDAAESVLTELRELNLQYENKFGHVFLICATGKSAEEMLAALKNRIGNSIDQELQIAAGEHEKITKIRLGKVLNEET